MECSNNFNIMTQDTLYSICKYSSKKDLINLSSTDKSLASSLNKYFEILVCKEFKTEACDGKKIYMHFIESEEELIERINDLIIEIKPNTNYSFQCSLIDRTASNEKKMLEHHQPAVKIEIDNLCHKSKKIAKFTIINDDLIPSIIFNNKTSSIFTKVTFEYFEKLKPELGILDTFLDTYERLINFTPLKLFTNFLDVIKLIPPKSYNKVCKMTGLILNYLAKNRLNYLNFEFKDIDLNNLNQKNKDDLNHIFLYIIHNHPILQHNLEQNPVIIQLKSLFAGLSENTKNSFTFPPLKLLIETLDSYYFHLTGDKFEPTIEKIEFLIENFNIEDFKPLFFQVLESTEKLSSSVMEIDGKLNSLVSENRLYEAPAYLKNITDFTQKEVPKLILIGMLFFETVNLG